MKKQNTLKVLMAISGIMIISCSAAQQLPSKDTPMKQQVTFNRYSMDKWPDPRIDIVTDEVRPSNLWTRATYYEGVMALHRIKGNEDYLDYALEWARSHDWHPTYGLKYTRDGDHQCCGQNHLEVDMNGYPEGSYLGIITYGPRTENFKFIRKP